MFPASVLPDPEVLEYQSTQRICTCFHVLLLSRQTNLPCPLCGRRSDRVHSRYARHVADLPMCGHKVTLELLVRKFFCDEVYCERQVFCERLPTVVEPYSRRTIRLTEALNPVSMLVSAEVGRKITRPMGIRTSPDSLLRVARQCPEENEQSELTKVGIDDWAKRKGYTYGTIIIDLERGHPVALLPDRETATVKSWREQHPKLKLITRDRATAYAEACTEGAPQAEQIADLWHLLKNLREEGWEVLQQRQASELQDWLSRMRGCGVPEPQSLARGLERDYDAVRAALENQNTNGPTEGHVNRLKMLKRMMYGRANFDLLRAKVLYRG